MEDCDDFIDLKFKKSNDIYIKLQKLMLLDSPKKKINSFLRILMAILGK